MESVITLVDQAIPQRVRGRSLISNISFVQTTLRQGSWQKIASSAMTLAHSIGLNKAIQLSAGSSLKFANKIRLNKAVQLAASSALTVAGTIARLLILNISGSSALALKDRASVQVVRKVG